MDNIIAGLFAISIFLAFAIGLAASINALPFSIIVGTVSIMLLIDFAQSVRNKSKDSKDGE